MGEVAGGCWDAGVEAAGRDALEGVQDRLLPGRIRKAYADGALYRQLWDGAGLGPGDYRSREDLGRFPMVDKDMVRAFRMASGDPVGGLMGRRPGDLLVTTSTGTSGVPTVLPMSSADVVRAGEELATLYWQVGVRAGSTILLSSASASTRAGGPMQEGLRRIGCTRVVVDGRDVERYVQLLEWLRPEVISVFPGFTESLATAARAMGKRFHALTAPVRAVVFAGRHLVMPTRRRLEEIFGAEVFEMGGLGDIGLWVAECAAHDGLHVRDDFFAVEHVAPDGRREPVAGELGELVYTSLWEETLSYVRWRSEDVGAVSTEPCPCGRTTTRIWQRGRTWERTWFGGRPVMPQEIEDVLAAAFGGEPYFQIVRPPDGEPSLRVAARGGLRPRDVPDVLADRLGLAVAVQEVDLATILDGAPSYKYRQVLDLR